MENMTPIISFKDADIVNGEVCYYFESKGYKFQDAGDLRA